jgi:hypothetical protein
MMPVRGDGTGNLRIPRNELVEAVAKVVGMDRTYYGDIRMTLKPKITFTEEELGSCIEYLVASGLMDSKGDGFGVRYWLTDKGLARYNVRRGTF